MFGKVILLTLGLACLAQNIEAKLPIFVIAEYTPKFAALAKKVAASIPAEYKEISTAQNIMQSIIDVAQDSVDDQIANLDDDIRKAIEEANKSGHDIRRCLTQENQQRNTINLKALNQCKVKLSWILDLKNRVSQMAGWEVSIGIDSNWCIVSHPISGSKLKTCFDGVLNKYEKALANKKQEIGDLIMQKRKESEACVGSTLGVLDLEIQIVEENFEYCTVYKNPKNVLKP